MEAKQDIKAEKSKSLIVVPWSFRSICFKFCAIVAAIMLLLWWVCTLQLASLSNTFMVGKYLSSYNCYVPPERLYENNGYLMFQCNGGLNQMRTGICDMVAVARYLNVTLIVPELDASSYWNDKSDFQDIFDLNHFITSLRDEVRILKELPPEQKRKVELESLYSMSPITFASLRYYYNRILPRIRNHEVLLFTRTDFRLANNGLPEELQKLRCRVNFEAIKFTRPIEELGKKIVRLLRQKGPFLVLHLRYEMDILSFTGCTEGCTSERAEELTEMRYAHPGWKHREMNSKSNRLKGLCPLTPEETALVLKALGIDHNMQMYIAAGDIYGGEEKMANLTSAYNLVRKETLLEPSDLRPFLNHSNQMAALDYIVAVESDIFVPTFEGNMERVVEGHRRYLGFRKTIILDRKFLVNLIDKYKNGKISWDEFSQMVKSAHGDHTGKLTGRLEIPDQRKDEDYFYSNPHECQPTTNE